MIEFLNSGFGAVALFVAVTLTFVMIFGAAWLMIGRNQLQRRLEDVADHGDTAAIGAGQLRQADDALPFEDFTKRISKSFGPKDEEQKVQIRTKFAQAGFYHSRAAEYFYASRVVLAAVFPLLGVMFLPNFVSEVTQNSLIITIFGSAVLGFYAPEYLLNRRMKERQQAVREGLPDALDILLVCVEAGASLPIAIQRMADEMEAAYPVLAKEFSLVSLELKAGSGRAKALKNLADRVNIEEIRSLVTLLVQSEALGTSIVQTLRVFSSEMRNKRLLIAEEKANKLPVKMALPLMLCILPALMIVILAPVIIRMVRVVLPGVGG